MRIWKPRAERQAEHKAEQERIAALFKRSDERAQEWHNGKVLKWFEDHYWDSLEDEKELIMAHIRACPLLKSQPSPL